MTSELRLCRAACTKPFVSPSNFRREPTAERERQVIQGLWTRRWSCVLAGLAVWAAVGVTAAFAEEMPSAPEALRLPLADSTPTFACEPPAQRVELERNLLCVRGLHPTTLKVLESDPLPGRVVQWDAPDILPRGDELTAAWPTGVVSIRISQGSLRDVPGPLVPSTLPDMLEGQEGPFTYHYPQALRFRGEHLFIRCRPTLLPAARGIYVESCAVFIPMPNDLRLTVYADAGAFYDGGPGWPTLLRDYDPAAWQASLDEVAAFLDVVVLSRERRSEFNPGAGEP